MQAEARGVAPCRCAAFALPEEAELPSETKQHASRYRKTKHSKDEQTVRDI